VQVSLSETTKFIEEQYPILDNKPALMRAFKKTTLIDVRPSNAWPSIVRVSAGYSLFIPAWLRYCIVWLYQLGTRAPT